MNVIAVNGSPRHNGTTATLLNKALEGAASRGAKTELIQLSQLKMKGCQACYSCKKRGGRSYGKCALRDDMTPLYAKIEDADAIFLGSPIYFGTVTSGTKMFIERLFPYFSYKAYSSNFPKKIPVGLVVTMGVNDQEMEGVFRQHIQLNQGVLWMLLGPTEVLVSTDTLHVENYSEIVADALEPRIGQKLEHQRKVLPLDCEKAFEMGARFAGREGSP
jgi:multimeric flavodoxin WrbA